MIFIELSRFYDLDHEFNWLSQIKRESEFITHFFYYKALFTSVTCLWRSSIQIIILVLSGKNKGFLTSLSLKRFRVATKYFWSLGTPIDFRVWIKRLVIYK
jgi:hypothetical protein